jgi:eukaryotic-like serine/threonine-protein kinase
MIGQTLGHYHLVEKLGEGGMGVVYRARDLRLDREVALKVLPAGTLSNEAARKRFRKEALALSKLNHPHIATIYDFDSQGGVDFLVMEYLAGVTLAEKLKAGALPEKEVVRLGTQVAAALEEAHECGVVHCDLKPGNIALTPKGQSKLLDFGLAKLLQHSTDDASTQTFTNTQQGAGTLPYMSPEQLRGESIDARSDIYAAGAVLYEMATSQRPFCEQLAARLTDAILHRPPPLPSAVNRRLSPALDTVILKTLDKDPEHRYQSAKELRIDLERLNAPSVIVSSRRTRTFSDRKVFVTGLVLVVAMLGGLTYFAFRSKKAIDSIAILPFVNQTLDPNADYLSDGIADAIINKLSELPNLKVISRTSAFRFKGRDIDPRVVGRELGVRAIVTGSIRQVGDAISVNIELVDADDNRHLWGEQENRTLANLFTVQEDVAKRITDNLRVKLTGGEKGRLAKRPTDNAEAYQLYLKGRYYYAKRTPDSWKRAHEFFEQAVQRDPNYALAWAGLADTASMITGPSDERRIRSKDAYQKALQLDDTLAEVHTVIGRSKLSDEWDWDGAQRELRRAIDLNPNYAEAHHSYSHYLMAKGRVEESLQESKLALELDPLDLGMNAHLAWHYLEARQYDQAITQCHKTLEMDANYVLAHLFLGMAYDQQRKYPEAVIEFEKASAVLDNPVGFTLLPHMGHAYAMAGRKAEALKVIDRLQLSEPRRPFDLAIVYQGLGDHEMALKLLKDAVDKREQTDALVDLGIEPTFDSLRSDPRFQALMRRIGLPS